MSCIVILLIRTNYKLVTLAITLSQLEALTSPDILPIRELDYDQSTNERRGKYPLLCLAGKVNRVLNDSAISLLYSQGYCYEASSFLLPLATVANIK